jgi:hypothetical protein
MTIAVSCPQCGHQFPLGEAVSEEYKKDLRDQMIAFTRKKEEEFQKRQEELGRQQQLQQDQLTRKWAEEKKMIQQTAEETLRKTIVADYENKMLLLQQAQQENEEKLREARRKELEYLQKEQGLAARENELELTLQRKLMESRKSIAEEIRQWEEQKAAARETEHQLRIKELEKQIDVQRKLAETMQRKAEQGSMQLQGEAQELALEEMLREAFPFDLIAEVGKGVRGADCIQTVRNQFGQSCGSILYESKRTNNFGADWIEKLKADLRSQGADLAVLVTRVMPRDMNAFGAREGVWICNFAEARALAAVLRDGLIRIWQAGIRRENQGDKMQLLYDYLTSNEFSEQWKAVREGFVAMKASIQRERDAMERLWKAREKQLEKVLLSVSHIKGSVDGIAGQYGDDLRLSWEEDQGLLD